MTLCEVLFKVGDSNPGSNDPIKNWRDGQVIEVRPPGILITPAEIIDWVQNQNQPPSLSTITVTRRRKIRLDIERIRLLTTLSRPQIDARLSATESTEMIDALIADADARRMIILATGYDSNWMRGELSVHAVITADISFAQLFDLIFEPELLTTDPLLRDQPTWARRLYRFKYEDNAPAPVLAAMRDRTVFVPPWRGAPFAQSDFEMLVSP